jgi:hypothetical protein
MALNFKNIQYDTEWLEYPDIKPKLQALYVDGSRAAPLLRLT